MQANHKASTLNIGKMAKYNDHEVLTTRREKKRLWAFASRKEDLKRTKDDAVMALLLCSSSVAAAGEMVPRSGREIDDYENENRTSVMMLVAMAASCTSVFWMAVWCKCRRGSATKPATRTVATQSQTKYTWWHVTPRFVPLLERDEGAWPEGR